MKKLVTTPSKLNLFLKVTGVRPDGYHELETLFVPLKAPADILELELNPDDQGRITIQCDSPAVPENESNICFKAARLTMDALNRKDSIHIRIQKNIPVAAGMGGGSSDAAAVIRTIQEMTVFLPDRGRAIALQCGADVPFFLNPVPSIGRGIGEILEPVEGLHLPDFKVHPAGFPVSTPWAYKHQKDCSADTRTLEDLLAALRTRNFPKAGSLMRNDLAPAVWEKFPHLAIMKQQLLDDGAICVNMTGSGPTLFSF